MRRRALPGALLLACAAACAAPRHVPARGEQVRLDIVARALAQARADHELRCPARACDRTRPPLRALSVALSDAELTLERAQRAADRFAAGDGRSYARVRPRLAHDLERLAARLQAVGHAVPPGLLDVIAPRPSDEHHGLLAEAPDAGR